MEHLNEAEYKRSGSTVLKSMKHAAVRDKIIRTLLATRFVVRFAVRFAVSLHTVCACVLACLLDVVLFVRRSVNLMSHSKPVVSAA